MTRNHLFGTAVPGALARSGILVAVVLAAGCGRGGPAAEAMRLYNQGKYDAALPLLVQAVEAGKNGTLLYQLGYCREAVNGTRDERRAAWKEAEPLLEQEIAAPAGGTLDRLYYLTVINSDQGEYEAMDRYARQAIQEHEKGPGINSLSGEDWFRLGRLHDFLSEASEAEAAYRRAVSSFSKHPAANPSYQALALLKVADYELNAGRAASAAPLFDDAAKNLPANAKVPVFRHALALLGAGRYADAAARFGEDRDETTMTESQYGADIAKKALEVEAVEDPAAPVSVDGLQDLALVEALKAEGAALRQVREKNSVKPGEPLPAEVALHQKRFMRLLAGAMVRHQQIQELCLRENLADLVRR